MSKSGGNGPTRTLGGKAYAAMAAVEGLRLNDAGRKRLQETKKANLTQEERRAEVKRAYKDKSTRR